jgi:hypothetical protein
VVEQHTDTLTVFPDFSHTFVRRAVALTVGYNHQRIEAIRYGSTLFAAAAGQWLEPAGQGDPAEAGEGVLVVSEEGSSMVMIRVAD